MGIVVAVASVLGMSVMVHLVDGTPILPATAFDWRESLEYVASIALAFVLGPLIAVALQPFRMSAVRGGGGAFAKLAAFLAQHAASGKGKKPLEERLERLVKLIKIAVSVSTAAGSIYTGFKGVLF